MNKMNKWNRCHWIRTQTNNKHIFCLSAHSFHQATVTRSAQEWNRHCRNLQTKTRMKKNGFPLATNAAVTWMVSNVGIYFIKNTCKRNYNRNPFTIKSNVKLVDTSKRRHAKEQHLLHYVRSSPTKHSTLDQTTDNETLDYINCKTSYPNQWSVKDTGIMYMITVTRIFTEVQKVFRLWLNINCSYSLSKTLLCTCTMYVITTPKLISITHQQPLESTAGGWLGKSTTQSDA